MNLICRPASLQGSLNAIPSKSDAHRKLICAALSQNGGCLPIFQPFCDDIAATIRCLTALGASFQQTENGLFVSPIQEQPHAGLDCGESGSTLRFLLPVAMCVCKNISVTGSGRLPERPISVLTDEMSAHGVQFSAKSLPISAAGRLTGGLYEIPGNISSQFLSGLLMALPLCDQDSKIRLTTPLQSAAYVDMTLDTLREFGVAVEISDEGGLLSYDIKGKQILQFPNQIRVDGDWSNAAFWLTAGAIQSSGAITLRGLHSDSVQGDKEITHILKSVGADFQVHENEIIVSCGTIKKFDVSMREIPDLLPILAILAAVSDGESHFLNAERLRLKESDRLQSTADMLRALGGNVDEHDDGLTVYGGQLNGGTVNAQNDHRLVMAAAVAALRCKSPVRILGAEAVNKSYPAFFDDYRALGGIAEAEPE
ncbi:MAG: 3-phosphoshikimate 1-carboxyvinyltransferase [Oscillospiraceae bacterium]|nr:3-phosphoshikimate 1-carboxyvinyltransferase [Oscillospiraceae bacterium]